eukprot:PhF_6_TR28865/c0_g1_i1/m.42214
MCNVEFRRWRTTCACPYPISNRHTVHNDYSTRGYRCIYTVSCTRYRMREPTDSDGCVRCKTRTVCYEWCVHPCHKWIQRCWDVNHHVIIALFRTPTKCLA